MQGARSSSGNINRIEGFGAPLATAAAMAATRPHMGSTSDVRFQASGDGAGGTAKHVAHPPLLALQRPGLRLGRAVGVDRCAQVATLRLAERPLPSPHFRVSQAKKRGSGG